ncbi:MAG: tRNA (adenosine(37)-N6)-dimethylallyltransferase MiaA [Ruminococcaceae bacterium]|nr:tRNA (adenosine(37)-N6)-dimethylallyltransferase MiaA [Oscillospiraceae bacterium]
MKQPLLMIAGPTASGKTAVAVELAVRHGGEVVSADSMQIYRRMDIGTAKPTKEEMRGIPHHLLDVADLNENFSVADYTTRAERAICEIANRGKLPILAGGTGLYLRAVTDHLDFSEGQSDLSFRESLQKRAKKEGSQVLHSELNNVDPESAMRIHPNDEKRLIRALEVYHVTGITMTEHQKKAASRPSPYATLRIGLHYEREKLYDRINHRVDKMLERGLEEEVASLLENMKGTSFQSIGYKEMEQYFKGNMTLSQAADEIRQASRRYAKRQMTFFKADKRMIWVDATDRTAAEVADEIETLQGFPELFKI